MAGRKDSSSRSGGNHNNNNNSKKKKSTSMGAPPRKNTTATAAAATTTEFIGFSAFVTTGGGGRAGSSGAAGGSSSSSSPSTRSRAASSSPHHHHHHHHPQFAPVYTGSDAFLRQLFLRIVSKRDPSTLGKALDDLSQYMDDPSRNKKDQVDALMQFSYQFLCRLSHPPGIHVVGGGGGSVRSTRKDKSLSASPSPSPSPSSSPSPSELTPSSAITASPPSSSSSFSPSSSMVRASCVRVFESALRRVPKATLGLLLGSSSGESALDPRGGDDGDDDDDYDDDLPPPCLISGILYCWQCDPSSDVRSAAQRFVKQLKSVAVQSRHKQQQQQQDERQQEPSSDLAAAAAAGTYDDEEEVGLVLYSRRVLVTGIKPLSVTSGETGGEGGAAPPRRRPPHLVEDLEEAKTQLAGTVLAALAMHLSAHASERRLSHSSCWTTSTTVTTSDTNDHDEKQPSNLRLRLGPNDVALWCQSSHSPSPTVRRGAYQLLSVVALRRPDLLHSPEPDVASDPSAAATSYSSDLSRAASTTSASAALRQALARALSAERQPGNVPALLELVLAAVSSSTTTRKSPAGHRPVPTASRIILDEEGLGKPLAKLVRKAGYGSRADQWGPILLPLVASAVAPLPLLQAIVQGRSCALGQRDAMAMLICQVECSTYLLLRTPTATSPVQNGSVSVTSSDVAGTPEDPSSLNTSFGAIPTAPETSLVESTTYQGSSTVLADAWLDAWDASLRQEAGLTAVESSHSAVRQLAAALAKSWIQLESASRTRRTCEFWRASEEGTFWDRAGQPWIQESKPYDSTPVRVPMVTVFLRSIAEQLKSNRERSDDAHVDLPRLAACVKPYFARNLLPYRESSSAVPTEDAYRLFHQVLNLPGSSLQPSRLLPLSVERFVMNDLLRWMILHTSQLSTAPQSLAMVRHDFEILAQLASERDDCSTQADMATIRQHLWPRLLQELIKAKLALRWCVVGLQTLLQHPRASAVEWIPCPALDDLATSSIVLHLEVEKQDAPNEDDDSSTGSFDEKDESHVSRERLDFFRMCFGFNATRTRDDPLYVLVSRSTIAHWLNRACPSLDEMARCTAPLRRDPTLLSVLLEAVRRAPHLVNEENTYRILFTSWLGRQFFTDTFEMLKENSLRSRFLDHAPGLLRKRLDWLSEQPDEFHRNDSRALESWVYAAWGLLHVSEQAGATNRLDLLGLSDITKWKNFPDVHFFLLSHVIERLEHPRDRLALIQSSSCSVTDLLLAFLLTVSEASPDVARADRVKSRCDRSSWLISAICEKDLKEDILNRLIDSAVCALSHMLQELPTNVDRISNSSRRTVLAHVGVLYQLISAQFRPLADPRSGLPSAGSIREGDYVWYITNPSNSTARELALVAKVHFDPQAGYYYSIELDKGDGRQERQTVLERLRLVAEDDTLIEDRVSFEKINEEERKRRANLRGVLMRDVITPFLAQGTVSSLIAEIVPVVCEYLGLGPERGVGTDHYQIVQQLRAVTEGLSGFLQLGHAASASQTLTTMALAFGYGLNVRSAARLTLPQLAFDPTVTFEPLLRYYEASEIGSNRELDRAALMWLSTALSHVLNLSREAEASCELPRIISAIFRLSIAALSTKNHGYPFTGDDAIASRAMLIGLRVLAISGPISECSTVAEEAARFLVRSFCQRWPDQADDASTFGVPRPDWRSASSFSDIVSLCRSSPRVLSVFMSALDASLCEDLSQGLLVESKRQACMFLLDSRLRMGRPMFENVTVLDVTVDRLQDWASELEDEEADEVRDDVAIVSRWLPRRIMSEIEEWGEKVYEESGDEVTVGRLLMWLCVLGVVDTVSPEDFRYRPAFVSYLHRSGAANAALNLALLQGEAIHEAQPDQPPPLLDVHVLHEDESSVTLTNVSSLVLFATVEVLPSLSRRWWEESCPGSYKSDVQKFVERSVAPTVLQREVARIRSSTSTSAGGATSRFGDMEVRSSLATRHVTANYVQDDVTLSVSILIPPDFPLKSAIVDCSKTLGVPERRWKRWSLQITLMLNGEGGTLQDALMLWKDNVDREFDGVEPCPVCYSVLQVKTHKLPSLECRTCKNRFHADCLGQWFRSSGKSSCVLCQQPWQGNRVA